MVKIPQGGARSKTAKAIFDAMVAKHAKDEPRPRGYMGCSSLGKECAREVWYSFRWAMKVSFSGRILRLFDRGHREEGPLLRLVDAIPGVTVTAAEKWGLAPELLRVNLGGHVRGNADARVLGLPDAPKTEHVLDVKTANEKAFKRAKACGDDLKKWNPAYYAQAQLYMRGLRLKRAVYIIVNKNDDDIHVMPVRYDAKEAARLEQRGHHLSTLAEPPVRQSDDPSFYKCKWCNYQSICHYGEVDKIERNCRTCLSVTPRPDGTWWCDRHQKRLDEEEQFQACEDHLVIPTMTPWVPVEYDEDAREVTYQQRDGVSVVDTGEGFHVRAG